MTSTVAQRDHHRWGLVSLFVGITVLVWGIPSFGLGFLLGIAGVLPAVAGLRSETRDRWYACVGLTLNTLLLAWFAWSVWVNWVTYGA